MLEPAREVFTPVVIGPAPAVADGPQVFALSGGVLLLMWDASSRVWSSARLEPASGPALAPLGALRLQREDGGTRLLFAFRKPAEAQSLSLFAGVVGQSVDVTVDPAEDMPVAQAEQLLNGLTPAARVSLVTTVMETWASIFRLRSSRSFNRFVYNITRVCAGKAAVVRAVARLDGKTALVEGGLPPGSAAPTALHLISPERFSRITSAPRIGSADARGQRRFYLALEGADDMGETLILLTGPKWMAVRRLEWPAGLGSLARWWRAQGKPDPVLREYALGLAAKGSPAARAAALELQLQAPLQPRALSGGSHLPSAELDLALSTSAGLLAGGWVRDPLSMIEGIDLMDGETAIPLHGIRHDFPGVVGQGEEAVPVKGFVALTEGSLPLLQPRFALNLKSGERQILIPPPQPVDLSEKRSRALKAVPPQFLTPEVLSGCLAPALAAIQKDLLAELDAPRVITIGERVKEPDVSIVVPLYRVLDFLRFQIGAFAADRALRAHAEVIYVLDSPEQADGVEHLLRGLHLLYDLPLVLVVMARNAGFAAASNAGAREARGEVVAQVNSDVIPIAPGWLAPLCAALEEDGVGAVGPKLLFGDGSLQHAGMYFMKGMRGQWLNHHFHKGMPRDYPAAGVARSVPAVTGACLLMRRSVYEDVGGFTEDYVIGDYEDSDLCLKVRAKDLDVRYVPQAELYHLERRSMKVSPDHGRGTASAYNAWLHGQRWGDTMGALMAAASQTGSAA
ncbi:glycosyl transferase family 2 [Azorhizobium oxalatiphilum]|uniref:Glycosyl transferase family 2 n=1 Tax=Azorhizobium oxalatiphilum TaxID=980631 RepID=A0A917C0V1_9HYPH|nr:glycosyltransferase [Azorhizobium oxalatiphilum]GGF66414.1 glycosyl transferase family 2 [Azorhizobium oxalatiphilum]